MFCFPFEARFARLKVQGHPDAAAEASSTPRMFFQVNSLDTWDLHRPEGCAPFFSPDPAATLSLFWFSWLIAEMMCIQHAAAAPSNVVVGWPRYGFAEIPTEVGSYDISVGSWRPVGDEYGQFPFESTLFWAWATEGP